MRSPSRSTHSNQPFCEAARRKPTGFAIVFYLATAVGCNTLIGADDPTLRVDDASIGQACVLNSNCTTPGQVCIFRVCSPPCATDGDCSGGSRCLKTDIGTACVVNGAAACGASLACPTGTACESGFCRNTCGTSGDCLSAQQCAGGICLGADPAHDPGLDASGGGTDSSTDQTAVEPGSADAHSERSEDSTLPGAEMDAAGDVAADSTADVVAESTADVAAESTADVTADRMVDAFVEAGCGNTNTDLRNCGSCGKDCTQLQNVSANGLACNGGQCSYQCTAGHADCGDAGAGCATDLSMSPNCGACGVTCSNGTPLCAPSATAPGGYACNSGCPAAAPMLCNMSCVDPKSSPANCGTCNHACSAPTPFCANSSCVECTSGTQCAPTGNTVQACVNNQWQSQTACTGTTPVCYNGACVECVSGTRCAPTGNTIQSCVNNMWQDQTSCTNTTPLCSNGSCVQCTGGTQCATSGNTVQSCVNNMWQNQTTCSGTMPVCYNGACVACTSGMQCAPTGNTVQSCVGNMWQDQMACTGPTPYCVGASCVECTAGTTCGANNTPQTCVNNHWVNQTQCSGTMPACFNGGCVQCTGGTQCSGNWVQSCVSNMWQNQTMCTMTEVCRVNACVNAVEDIGWGTALPGSFTVFANILYLLRLRPLVHDATLQTFGVVGTSTTAGASAKLVLYADNGAGTAPSGADIAGTSSPFPLIMSAKEQTADTNATLSAGATYWLGIVVDADTTISGQADAAQVGQKLSLGFTAAWPSGPSGGAIAPASDFAIYIKVVDLN